MQQATVPDHAQDADSPAERTGRPETPTAAAGAETNSQPPSFAVLPQAAPPSPSEPQPPLPPPDWPSPQSPSSPSDRPFFARSASRSFKAAAAAVARQLQPSASASAASNVASASCAASASSSALCAESEPGAPPAPAARVPSGVGAPTKSQSAASGNSQDAEGLSRVSDESGCEPTGPTSAAEKPDAPLSQLARAMSGASARSGELDAAAAMAIPVFSLPPPGRTKTITWAAQSPKSSTSARRRSDPEASKSFKSLLPSRGGVSQRRVSVGHNASSSSADPVPESLDPPPQESRGRLAPEGTSRRSKRGSPAPAGKRAVAPEPNSSEGEQLSSEKGRFGRRASRISNGNGAAVVWGEVPSGRRNSTMSRRTSLVSIASVGSTLERNGSGGPVAPAGLLQFQFQEVSRSFIEGLRKCSRTVVDSWRFNVLTTALTFYALMGDDFRLLATHKGSDVLFNGLTILCILIFTLEILVEILGREGYFLGFFFQLDLVCTVTLLFDLTWVANLVHCSTDLALIAQRGDTTSFQAKLSDMTSTRAGRTVRILRLIRLGKLYKTYRNAVEHFDVQSPEANLVPGSPDDELPGDVDEASVGPRRSTSRGSIGSHSQEGGSDGEKADMAEMRVGKKLSDMTTRRVIVLVLVMLFSAPFFLPGTIGLMESDSSGLLGTEMVYERWRSWCLLDGRNASLPWCIQNVADFPADSERQQQRAWLEHYLLTFIHSNYHGDFYWTLFWIGLSSQTAMKQDRDSAPTVISQLAQLNQERYLGPAALPRDRLWEWDKRYSNEKWVIKGSKLPEAVKQKLVAPWLERCSGFYGVSLLEGDAEKLGFDCSIEEELRCNEVQYRSPLAKTFEEGRHIELLFVFDIRQYSQTEAGLSILATIFMCFAVGLGALSFSNDANTLLLEPLQRIVAKMEAIKDSPLQAIKFGEIEYRREMEEQQVRELKMRQMGKCGRFFYTYRERRKGREPMETLILERTLIKLGGLLALGFGEAGAEVIGQNMQAGGAGVNAMVPGKKVDAIIGFCSIRNFGDATEVLKEKVMVFVNQVGEIVHGCVDNFHGAPNRNFGDSFLIVWRLTGALDNKKRKLADMALMSFVRINMEVHKSRVLAVYRNHPGLKQRISQYRVQLGFGLHCGWAIEGAIGSEFKIDASYLSPNVNVASRLGMEAEQFGVWILMSHFMQHLCSKEMAGYCRMIDHVIVEGSKTPIRIYTVDLDASKLAVKETPSGVGQMRNRFKLRQIRELLKNEKWAEDYKVSDIFKEDEDIVSMRLAYSKEFFLRFSVGFRNYEAGEWFVARDMFCACTYSADSASLLSARSSVEESQWPEDGPVRALLAFMRKTDFEPPSNWTGYRQLNEDVGLAMR
ncbi:unnamed protein product [Polarella glacialis]|uniref:Guanylate cyclase domain-containing protein n=1 Tax=Polarella glacialis TaxID=89957 RepID=A0A813FGU8_POLGL|nr:unnamed protein product [Polarella glacialis]